MAALRVRYILIAVFISGWLVVPTWAQNCPQFAAPLTTGYLSDPRWTDISGLAASRGNPGVFWFHNDGGPGAAGSGDFFAVSGAGTLLAEFRLNGVSSLEARGEGRVDVEGIAVGLGPGGYSYIYLADMGGNLYSGGGRNTVRIFRVREPQVSLGGSEGMVVLTEYETFKLSYPNGVIRDAETLMVDINQDIYIVTKAPNTGTSTVYLKAAPHQDATTTTLQSVATLQFGSGSLPGNRSATAGDISVDGDEALIRTYSNVFRWVKLPGMTWGDAFASVTPCVLPAASGGGYEAVAFDHAGTHYYDTYDSQGSTSATEPLNFYERVTVTTAGLQYYPLATPIRLLDTRPSEPACDAPGAPLVAGATRTEAARTACVGIPSNAQVIVGNATAVNTAAGSADGFITLYPSEVTRPTVSNLNYVSDQIVPNAFTVGLGSDGAFNIYASSTTHCIVDITGYYAPPNPGGLYYHALPQPVRLLDTRAGQPACDTPGTPLAGGASRTQLARTTCNGVLIPAEALAIVGNATVVNNVSGNSDGFVTLYPSGAPRPTASNLNYVPGQIVPNSFTVGLGADGAFAIYAQTATHFIVDVAGYYSTQQTDINGTGLLYYSLSASVRLLDTRAGQPACDTPGVPLTGGSSRTAVARTTCGGQTIPQSAEAVVGNATVVNNVSGYDHSGGFVTLYPSSAGLPVVSNLNYAAGQVVPNSFVVGLGNADGAFNVYAQTTINFIVDLIGYFAP